MIAKAGFILLLVVSSISCNKEFNQQATGEDLSGVPILGTLFSAFDQIVTKLTGHLVENSDKLALAVEGPTAAVLGSVNENIAAFTNSSKAFRRDVDDKNATDTVKDNEYYKQKYAGKYLKKFGKQAESKRATDAVLNKTELEELKATLVEIKDRASKELNGTLEKYGKELKKLSGEFVERSKQLGEGFKKKYKEITGEFVRKVKEARQKKKVE